MSADMKVVYDALRRADKAGDIESAKKLSEYILSVSPQAQSAQSEPQQMPPAREQLVPATPDKKSGFLQTVHSQGLQGMTFGFADEIMDMGAAFVASKLTDMDYQELYSMARDMSEEQLTKEIKDRPITSVASQLVGAVLTGRAGGKIAGTIAPKSTSSALKFAKNNPIKTSIATGAVSGGAYGVGTGSDENRWGDGMLSAVVGAVFGPLGYLGVKNFSKAIKRGKNLLPKFTGKRGAPEQVVRTTFDDMLDGDGIVPMTRGQREQNIRQLAAEDFALREGVDEALEVQSKQNQSAREYFDRAFGKKIFLAEDVSEAEHVDIVANLLRKKADAARLKRQEAYREAAKTNLGIQVQDIKDGFMSSIDDLVDEFNIEDLSHASKMHKRLKKLIKNKDAQTSGVLLKDLEKWNKSARALADQTSKHFRGDTEESLLLQNMRNVYNEFLDELSEQALLNGDETAILNFKKARSLAAQEFKLYKSEPTIRMIIQNRDLTNEQLANTLLGASKLDASKTKDLARIYDTLIDGAGADALVMKENIRNGILARVIKRSFSKNPNPMNTNENLINFTKMRNELDDLAVGNKTLFEKVFNQDEIKIINTLRSDLRKIAHDQTGTKNYSNSAIAASQWIRRMLPLRMFTSTVAGGLEYMGEQSAKTKGIIGLEDVMKQTYDQLDGRPVYYGGLLSGASTNREERE